MSIRGDVYNCGAERLGVPNNCGILSGNCILINMLPKRVEWHGQDWDHHLPYSLFE